MYTFAEITSCTTLLLYDPPLRLLRFTSNPSVKQVGMSSSSQSSSPNPHALAFRPAPIRAATTLSAGYPYKSRAASQPAGERIPAPDSQSSSVRESPGNGYGGAFGVIGGSRTPGPTGISLASLGTTTRANSFSAGEFREHGDNRVCVMSP